MIDAIPTWLWSDEDAAWARPEGYGLEDGEIMWTDGRMMLKLQKPGWLPVDTFYNSFRAEKWFTSSLDSGVWPPSKGREMRPHHILIGVRGPNLVFCQSENSHKIGPEVQMFYLQALTSFHGSQVQWLGNGPADALSAWYDGLPLAVIMPLNASAESQPPSLEGLQAWRRWVNDSDDDT